MTHSRQRLAPRPIRAAAARFALCVLPLTASGALVAQEHAGHVMTTSDSAGVVWRMPPQPIPMPMMLPGR